jgi:exonuclease SbcD
MRKSDVDAAVSKRGRQKRGIVTIEVGTPQPADSTDRPSLKILHVSDVHVDDNSYGPDALDAVVDVALAENVDFVIIAGDLFDHARVSAETVKRVIDALSRLQQPTLVIPGNHDCVDDLSIYNRVDLSAAGQHMVFVGDPAGDEVIFHDLALAIWARGIEDHSPKNRPLEGFRPSDPRYWRIVVVHGHYVPAGHMSPNSSLIREEEIAALECDYVALGHWHRFLEINANGVLASYCGSPSEGSDPSVNLVYFEPGQPVRIEVRPLAAELA